MARLRGRCDQGSVEEFVEARNRSDEVVRCVEKNITEDQNMMLLAPFTAVDVKDALFVLTLVVSAAQSAFIPGRAITDNIIISAEILHFLKRKRQGKHGCAALKIDMSKAYDRIEWKFLQAIMLKMGFAEKWVDMIMLYVSTVQYNVLRNGKEVGPIIPSRGLRQGDLLSPYLFILCAEGLSSLIRVNEKAGLIHGVKVTRSAPTVSHLFFADDSFLFFRANQQEAVLMRNILASYSRASGQKVNFSKSSISFSANVHVDDASQKLQMWNIRMLSRAGKEVLLKTMAQAMPNYVMNVYLLPLDLCKELEIMMNSFWWVGSVWKLLTSPTSLVAKVLKARYFPRSSVLDAKLGFNSSFIWRSIMAAKDVVIRGSRIQIGSGQHVIIGKDPWLPDLEDGFTTSELPEEIVMAPVCSLMVVDERRWDYDVVTNLFNTRDRDLILKIPLSVRRDHDLWHWLVDPGGVFSVRSCYKLMTYDANNSSLSFWRRLWKLDVPSKVKNFLWRAATNVLPTYDNLLRRRVQVLPLCVVCNTCNESIIHILVDCGFAKACWIASPIGYIGHISSFMEWLGIIFNCCSKEECELAAMVCWRIWVQRNDKVWNSRCGQVYQILNSAGHLLHQWQYWRKQLLFDDAVGSSLSHGASKISFGCVVRNFEGTFLAAKCDCFAGSFGAREAEALGVREALSWLKCLHLPRVIIEVDYLQVFKALTENLSSPNGFGLIIEECRFLAHELGEVQFSFVRRSANVAAHRVARVGGSLSGPNEWSVVPPRWLMNNL
ncbi:putative reverse transcriptase/RNA-dependent DNA polymerase [Citrus sinensis]|nr:putative reverse transcriptase/RNA-dependent DNA polymerase [Citrus sinensis]